MTIRLLWIDFLLEEERTALGLISLFFVYKFIIHDFWFFQNDQSIDIFHEKI